MNRDSLTVAYFADDSARCVDALHDAPGRYSARTRVRHARSSRPAPNLV